MGYTQALIHARECKHTGLQRELPLTYEYMQRKNLYLF